MLSRLAQPTLRRGAHAFFRPSTHMRQFKVLIKLIKIFLKLIIIIIKGEFNSYPPKKVYYGRGNMSGEVILLAGFSIFLFSFHQLVNADYIHNSYCMSSSHFNMG